MSVQGPFMEFISAKNTLSAANTYTEDEIIVPTSRTELMAMLIHDIWFAISSWEGGVTNKKGVPKPLRGGIAESDMIQMQLTKAHKEVPITYEDPDLIAYIHQRVILGTVFHALLDHGHLHWHFDPPVLYPRAKLFFGAVTTGFTDIKSFFVKIGYTLARVSREDFIAALVE